MTRRSFSHARTEAQIAYLLKKWLEQQPAPRGLVLSGEAGFRLGRNPDSSVGIDVAYISAEPVAATPQRAFLVDGQPVLAVEILSPSDRNDDVTNKVWEYIDAGVKLVWRVEPMLGLITVFRPDAEPEAFNIHGYLDGEPRLPGFRVAVAEIFAGSYTGPDRIESVMAWEASYHLVITAAEASNVYTPRQATDLIYHKLRTAPMSGPGGCLT